MYQNIQPTMKTIFQLLQKIQTQVFFALQEIFICFFFCLLQAISVVTLVTVQEMSEVNFVTLKKKSKIPGIHPFPNPGRGSLSVTQDRSCVTLLGGGGGCVLLQYSLNVFKCPNQAICLSDQQLTRRQTWNWIHKMTKSDHIRGAGGKKRRRKNNRYLKVS